MNVYLIKASAAGPFKDYKKMLGAPPQNIFSVAAATPEGVSLTLCDETIGMKPNRKIKADLVALFFHTPDAVHAYQLADHYRSRGITVVLGGLHPSFCPDEAMAHADSLLLGEAEEIWPQLLDDQGNGTLQPRYQRQHPVDLATVKPYPTDLIPPSKYNNLWSVLVSRGCVHRCEFCAVPPFFKGKYRLRPIENIVAEIKAAPAECWFELHADSLTSDRRYALELFQALKPLGIKWIGEATIKLADDEELLRAAAESGCQELLIGIESSSKEALADSGKDFVDPEQLRGKIRRFHQFGITISSSMIFGFDSHTPAIFKECAEFCRMIEIDHVDTVLLIPFPGTPLYQRLESEKRILDGDWSHYDGAHAVYQPAKMSTDELLEGADWFWKEMAKKKSPASASTTASKTDAGQPSAPGRHSGGPRITRWKSLLALALIFTGLVFDLYWIWGVLFLIWGINDLRTRTTYLMEEIPRSESPIMYWIVVGLWLFLAGWTLLFSPAAYFPQNSNAAFSEQTRRVSLNVPDGEKRPTPEAVVTAPVQESLELKTGKSVEQLVVNTPSVATNTETILSTTARNSILQNVSDKRFALTFDVPAGWRVVETEDSDTVTFHVEESTRRGTVTVVATDMQEKFRLSNWIQSIENEFAESLPVIKNGKMTPVANPFAIVVPADMTMTFREYVGTYDNYPVRVIAGYGAKGQHGFALVSVNSVGDKAMEQTLGRIYRSFSLNNGR